MKKARINKDNARELQKKSAKKRHENKVSRDLVYMMLQKRLLGKKTISNIDLAELGDDLEGYKLGKKAVRAMLDLDKIRKKAIDTGNVRGYVELLKTAGFHFDQGNEAHGTAENPINIQSTVLPSPEMVKAISDALEESC